MKFPLTLVLAMAAGFVSPVYAQFGSGIVFDPTQSGHVIQQITQASQLYTTTVQTTQNVIAAYNLAQRMASLPQTLYTSYSNSGLRQWTALTTPANTYGNSTVWMNSASTGYGAASANQTAGIPRTGQITGYSSLSAQGQQATPPVAQPSISPMPSTPAAYRPSAPSARTPHRGSRTSANWRPPRTPLTRRSIPRWPLCSASIRRC